MQCLSVKHKLVEKLKSRAFMKYLMEINYILRQILQALVQTSHCIIVTNKLQEVPTETVNLRKIQFGP